MLLQENELIVPVATIATVHQVGAQMARHAFGTRDNQQTLLHKATPVYEELEGWPDDITACERFDDLPAAARKYVLHLSDLIGVPIRMLSVGPDRGQTLAVDA